VRAARADPQSLVRRGRKPPAAGLTPAPRAGGRRYGFEREDAGPVGPAHYRGTGESVERYGATVWAPPRAEWRRRPEPPTTIELSRGTEAIELVDEADRKPLLASLERIAELPVERVIVPHRESSVLLDGSHHIRAAVAQQ